MNNRTISITEIITIFIGVISIVIPLYFIILTSPEEIKTQTIIIFISIIIVLIISVGIIYIYNKWQKIARTVKSNYKNIIELNNKLSIKEIINKMDNRISIIEKLIDKLINKNKKAEIDPRIIISILLLILLFLFLRSVGVFG